MAQNINRRPKGLQSLLDSKNLGVNPSVLSETVAPVLSLDNLFYTDIPMQQATSNGVITTASAITPSEIIDVPVGETWAIRSWGAYVTPAASASTSPISLAPCFIPVIGGGFVIAGPPSQDPGNTLPLDASGFGITFETPLVVTGGNRLAVLPMKVQGLVGLVLIAHSIAYYPLDT